MASHGYPTALQPLPHEHHGIINLSKECQLISPIPRLKQGVLKLLMPNLRTYPLDKKRKLIGIFPESSHFLKIDPIFTRPVLSDEQGTAEQCARHERDMKIQILRANGLKKDDLGLSLMSYLVEFQTMVTNVHQHEAVANGTRFDTLVQTESPFVYPSKAIYGQKGPVKSIDDTLPHQAILINPNGKISFVGNVTQMIDWLLVPGEFYLPKGSARWNRQTMLFPQIKRTCTAETPYFVNEASPKLKTLEVAILKSTQKAKPKSTPIRKGKKKKAPTETNLYQKYLEACESFFSLMVNKNHDGTEAIKSFKRTSPELEKLLVNFSSTVAGIGAAVLLSVICIVAYGRVQFNSLNVLTTSVGIGLFWLSWAVHKLRDTIVYIRKSPANLGSEDLEEMIKNLDTNTNDIYRAAAFTVAAFLSLP